jgi:hypothetical protein
VIALPLSFTSSSRALDLTPGATVDAFVSEQLPGHCLGATAPIAMAPAGDASGPQFIQWQVDELEGTAAFGLSDGTSTQLYGSGLKNVYYVSDGRLVIDGVTIRLALPIAVGDVVGMYLDPDAGECFFMLNGVPV